MSTERCDTNHNPLCATLIFFAGCVLGTYTGHTPGIGYHDLIAVGVSTIVFYLTQLGFPKKLCVNKVK